MAACDHCGNDYHRTFQLLTAAGETFTFDCFECAIHLLAPTCRRCKCRVIGHGVESEGRYYCSAHCAREDGITTLVDHA